MTINLPEELASFVQEAVQTGRYAREEDVVRDALLRLRLSLPENQATSGLTLHQTEPTAPRRPATEEEFKQMLIDLGWMTELPTGVDPSLRPDFQPVDIEGEPLSETIIRERR